MPSSEKKCRLFDCIHVGRQVLLSTGSSTSGRNVGRLCRSEIPCGKISSLARLDGTTCIYKATYGSLQMSKVPFMRPIVPKMFCKYMYVYIYTYIYIYIFTTNPCVEEFTLRFKRLNNLDCAPKEKYTQWIFGDKITLRNHKRKKVLHIPSCKAIQNAKDYDFSSPRATITRLKLFTCRNRACSSWGLL